MVNVGTVSGTSRHACRVGVRTGCRGTAGWRGIGCPLRPGVAADVSSYVDSEGLPSGEAEPMALQLEQHGLVGALEHLSRRGLARRANEDPSTTRADQLGVPARAGGS